MLTTHYGFHQLLFFIEIEAISLMLLPLDLKKRWSRSSFIVGLGVAYSKLTLDF